ncbi:MAG: hypothetical protein HQK76_12090 [Desulfobacterales bacterium]|nr:hypothetical protein [Desulfobacterales bacterium]
MKAKCDKCQYEVDIPDEKLAPGKTIAFKCPRCRNKITITTTTPAQTKKNEDQSLLLSKAGYTFEDDDADDDVSDKPFIFAEEEGKTALICEQNRALAEKIESSLKNLEYYVHIAQTSREAMKRMRYHVYDIIVLNEHFETSDPEKNGVLINIEKLEISVRRNIFVALLTNRFRTFDRLMAFNKSVNLIVKIDNIPELEKIISSAVTDNDLFYRVFKESLKKFGKI